MVSQPHELNSSTATFVASEAKQDIDTIRWYHTAHDPLATIRTQPAAFLRTVEELRRAAVPVTAANMED